MSLHSIDDLVLTTIFVNSADLAGVRNALLLPPDLGENEAAFVRCASQILNSLGKGTPSSVPNSTVARFKTGWVEQLSQDLRDLQRVLAKLKAERQADLALSTGQMPP